LLKCCNGIVLVQRVFAEHPTFCYPSSERSFSLRSLNGVRVLLVEDDDDTRDLYEFVLQDAGAEVRAANGARQAVGAVTGWRPSVVVSDVAMPDMDGLSLLGQLRAAHGLERVPAIAVTAMVHPSDRAAAMAAGFQQHLSKPVDPDELIRAIGRLVHA
jgi:CheY-like chemotaxis protein